MFIQHHYLRVYRKKSSLTQNDLAYILDLGDYATVSRWEHGQRQPNIETLLTYRLLFGLPIELLFERQKRELMDRIVSRVRLLQEEIRKEPQENKAVQRIAFLTDAISRLNTLPSPYV